MQPQVIQNSKYIYNAAALQNVVLYNMMFDYENQGYSETLQIIEKQRTSTQILIAVTLFHFPY